MRKCISNDLPENMLRVDPSCPRGVPIDAISAACVRASAVLDLLGGQFDQDAHEYTRFSDEVIAAVIWDVQATIAQIKELARFGYNSTQGADRNGGRQ